MLMSGLVRLFGCLAACLPLASPPHPLSMAELELIVEEDRVQLDYRVDWRTLLEMHSIVLDLNGDGGISREELLSRWPELRGYFEHGLRLAVDDGVWELGFAQPDFYVSDFLASDDNDFFEQLILRAELKTAERARSIALEANVFFEDGNPGHLCHVWVEGLTTKRERYLLRARHQSARFPDVFEAESEASSHQGGFVEYVVLGWEHVLEGIDHLAFVLALLFGVANLRALLGAVTAFTLAHSITLAMAALDLWRLEPAIVEPGIAASVLLVTWWHLRTGPSRARAWLPAFAFGLIHGFGFAGVLGDIGLPTDQRVAALLGFNVGVELGQLSFVVPVLLLVAFITRQSSEEQHDSMRLTAGAVLGALGLYLTADYVTVYWLAGSFAGWPAELRAVPVAAVCLLVLALALRTVRAPTGQGLLAYLLLSGGLYGLFAAGRFLATASA